MAPTVIALGFLAGLPIVLGSGPLFPAAATTTIPCFIALLTALSIYLWIPAVFWSLIYLIFKG